jgi:hypothetical protein
LGDRVVGFRGLQAFCEFEVGLFDAGELAEATGGGGFGWEGLGGFAPAAAQGDLG